MARILLDVMCGGIRSHLRMCGHDAAYAGDRGVEADDELLALAREEDRTLVTRDRDLADAEVAIVVTERDAEGQLRELRAAGIALELDDTPTYCGGCNGRLERVAPEDPTPDYAPDPAETDVWRCRDCGQHFWKGSHWDRVRETIEGL